MTFIFDEGIGPQIVECLRDMEFQNVKHISEIVPRGTPDIGFLPGIGQRGDVLVTKDRKMVQMRGKNGHLAVLLKFKVKIILLPPSFGNARSAQQLIWIRTYWSTIMTSWESVPDRTLCKVSASGVIEPISLPRLDPETTL